MVVSAGHLSRGVNLCRVCVGFCKNTFLHIVASWAVSLIHVKHAYVRRTWSHQWACPLTGTCGQGDLGPSRRSNTFQCLREDDAYGQQSPKEACQAFGSVCICLPVS